LREYVSKDSLSFEILFIDDGSSDSSWDKIAGLAAKKQFVRGIGSEETMVRLQLFIPAFVRQQEML
jgi:glycosyltransferase involved in cell wall biosynthesis